MPPLGGSAVGFHDQLHILVPKRFLLLLHVASVSLFVHPLSNHVFPEHDLLGADIGGGVGDLEAAAGVIVRVLQLLS